MLGSPVLALVPLLRLGSPFGRFLDLPLTLESGIDSHFSSIFLSSLVRVLVKLLSLPFDFLDERVLERLR